MIRLLVFLAVSCMALTACSPGNSTAKGIKGILQRSDCKGPCGKKMNCEGKVIKLEMQLNNNIMTAGNTLFARDPDDYDYTIKIEFSSAVPIELYSDIKNPANKRFVVSGIVEGYDQYVHQVCTRSYIIKVSKAEDFSVFQDK